MFWLIFLSLEPTLVLSRFSECINNLMMEHLPIILNTQLIIHKEPKTLWCTKSTTISHFYSLRMFLNLQNMPLCQATTHSLF